MTQTDQKGISQRTLSCLVIKSGVNEEEAGKMGFSSKMNAVWTEAGLWSVCERGWMISFALLVFLSFTY